MSDTGYVTSELARAIASATSSKIDAPDGGSYRFHRFAFGERGDFIPAPLLDEIVGSLVSLAQRVFAAPDVIVSPEPGGHTWGMATHQVCHQLPCCDGVCRTRRDGASGFANDAASEHASILSIEQKWDFRKLTTSASIAANTAET
jgi:hypothetical protein